ncbi:hypothetical protein [Thiocystis minor]|nr:hypothetical protein [Thiocystis minor]
MTVDWSLYERPCYTIAEIVRYWCELPDQKNLSLNPRTRLPLADPDYL